MRNIFLLLFPLVALFAGESIQNNREGKRIFISTDSSKEAVPLESALRAGFEEIHAIDLYVEEHLATIERFGNRPNVHLYYSDSPPILIAILSSIQEPVLFWLNVFRKTPFSIWAQEMREKSPILRELAAIGNHPIKTHTILIGDAHLIGTAAFDFLTLNQLTEEIKTINPDYEITSQDNGHILVAKVGKK
ncbi:MAG TPA: hypothetical protein VLE89_04245 [Chlamydiales bacterium]|nr:hypothetical protein [Chlamydiales bacterium]